MITNSLSKEHNSIISHSRSLVNSIAALKELETGHYLWKVRRKRFRGVRWYKRKFRIDYEKLYLHYLPANNPISKKLYIVAPTKLFRYEEFHHVSGLK